MEVGEGADAASARRRGAASPRLLTAQIESDWATLVHRHEPIVLPPDAAPRGDFLLTPVTGTNQIRALRLSDELLSILQLFHRPRRLSEFRRAANMRATPPVMRQLVQAEALVAHRARIEPSVVGPAAAH
jgi:hypothetical protein